MKRDRGGGVRETTYYTKQISYEDTLHSTRDYRHLSCNDFQSSITIYKSTES